jgi:hypothetical protein
MEQCAVEERRKEKRIEEIQIAPKKDCCAVDKLDLLGKGVVMEKPVLNQKTAAPDTDAGNANEGGRAVVRRCFVDVVAAQGLARPKGMSVAVFDAGLDQLIGQLDHMGAENLLTLAEAVVAAAAKPSPDVGRWPAFVLVQAWANGIQRRPYRMSRIVTSWLASIEGPVAEAGGYLTELFRWLRAHQRPPTTFDLTKIKESSAENMRRVARIEERLSHGQGSQDDREWHSAYLADRAQARDVVDQGRAARALADKAA